nr:high mobility group B protein 15-like [Tanacetum cinerariifolium]
MGGQGRIPIVGGTDLDLHRLFVEVTSRGGIKKVLEEKKWKEVTNSFSFPPSATNASYILRKYYMSLIQHFEQVYYFKAKAWTPVSTGKYTLASTSGINKATQPLSELQKDPSQVLSIKRQRANVYQEKAMKDKERYRTEKEHYMESLRTRQLISNAVPLLQRRLNKAPVIDGGGSSQTAENELNPTCSDKSSFGNVAKPSHKECPRDVQMDPKDELLLVKELQHNESTMLHTDHENETNYQCVVEFDGTVENRTTTETESLKVSVDINENLDQELDNFQRSGSRR